LGWENERKEGRRREGRVWRSTWRSASSLSSFLLSEKIKTSSPLREGQLRENITCRTNAEQGHIKVKKRAKKTCPCESEEKRRERAD